MTSHRGRHDVPAAIERESTYQLVVAESYPVLQFVRKHGKRVAFGSAVATFLLVASGTGGTRAGRLVRATALAGAVGAGLAYMHEMTQVIGDTLLPQ
jgi:hypothetical protein